MYFLSVLLCMFQQQPFCLSATQATHKRKMWDEGRLIGCEWAVERLLFNASLVYIHYSP